MIEMGFMTVNTLKKVKNYLQPSIGKGILYTGMENFGMLSVEINRNFLDF